MAIISPYSTHRLAYIWRSAVSAVGMNEVFKKYLEKIVLHRVTVQWLLYASPIQISLYTTVCIYTFCEMLKLM
jgi:hypothetical protein